MYTTECVIVYDRSKEEIEADLNHLAPLVSVFASRMLEDGTELLLEGDSFQIQDLIYLWGQGEGEGEESYLPSIQ